MRVVKRVAAALFAVIIAFSVNVTGLAAEAIEDGFGSDTEKTTRETDYIYSVSVTIEVGDELSLSDIPLLSETINEDVYFSYIFEGLGNSNSKKIVNTSNEKITGLREGTAYVNVKSCSTGDIVGSIYVIVNPRQAHNFGELLKLTFEEIGKGFLNALEITAAGFLSVAFGITTPIVLAVMGIGSIFI